MSSSPTMLLSTARFSACALNSRATTESIGSTISQPRLPALARISRACRAGQLPEATCRPSCPVQRERCWPCRRRSRAHSPCRLGCRADQAWSRPFAPPTMAATGFFGLPSALSRASSSACMSVRIGRQLVCKALRRGMGAMRRRKGIVHIGVAKSRQRRDESRIVLLLVLMEAGVLKAKHIAIRHAAMAACAATPIQSSAKATGLPRRFATSAATGRRLSFGSGPFGRPKCAIRMTLPPLSDNSRMVGRMRSIRVPSLTAPFIHRHVEIDAHEDAPAGGLRSEGS